MFRKHSVYAEYSGRYKVFGEAQEVSNTITALNTLSFQEAVYRFLYMKQLNTIVKKLLK